MFLGGWLLAIGILWVYLLSGVFAGQIVGYIPVLTIIGLAATAVESLPIKDLDNITITLTSLIFGHLLL